MEIMIKKAWYLPATEAGFPQTIEFEEELEDEMPVLVINAAALEGDPAEVVARLKAAFK